MRYWILLIWLYNMLVTNYTKDLPAYQNACDRNKDNCGEYRYRLKRACRIGVYWACQ